MSPVNVEYVLQYNSEIDSSKMKICLNSYAVSDDIGKELSYDEKISDRKKSARICITYSSSFASSQERNVCFIAR